MRRLLLFLLLIAATLLQPALALSSDPPPHETPVNPPSSVKASEIVQFGGYSWCVLEVRDGKALLLAEKIIEANLYNLYPTDVTWESCFLRDYLNGIFLQNFTHEEQERIVETSVNNPDNLWYGTPGGADTYDKVFLLSLEEVDRYFGDSGDYLTGKRKLWHADGIEENDEGWAFSNAHDEDRAAIYGYGPSWWWLRSPGSGSRSAAAVDIGGSVNVRGRDVDAMHPDMGGVRPALWLNVDYGTDAGIADTENVTYIKLGQDASITVSENETTPYRWVIVLSDETVLEQTSDEYIQEFSLLSLLGASGVGGNHRFDFRAIGEGACSVDMYLVRIGDSIDEAAQVESYLFIVED